MSANSSATQQIGIGVPESASFRDPSGYVVRLGSRILRFVGSDGLQDFKAFQSSAAAQRFVSEGLVVGSKTIDGAERSGIESALGGARSAPLLLEHELIPFPSYPYEWSPAMLFEAGALTLDIAGALLDDGLGMKDATPYNILFRGAHPVLVDILSIERRDPQDPLWRPYAQFLRTFCIPLLLNKRLGVPLFDLLIGRRDGLEPEQALRWLGYRHRFAPGVLAAVTLPALLGRSKSNRNPRIYAPRTAGSPEQAAFTLKMRYRAARRILHKAKPSSHRGSAWSAYDTNNTYSAEQVQGKEELVRSAIRKFQCRSVLDLGSNTGRFSLAALDGGAERVVAADSDPEVIDRLFLNARSRNLPILPLVLNFARPSPATGWRNSEARSFLDRATGHFDCVIALAFLHHMLVTERVPLPELLDTLAGITTNLAVLEFVSPEDEMFQALLRGREHLFRGLDTAAFEHAAAARFHIVARQPTSPTRTLFTLQKRGTD